MDISEFTLSIVIPCYNESKTIDYISGKSMRRISVKDESNLYAFIFFNFFN